MKIEKIETGNILRSGQLLIGSNDRRWFGPDASLHVGKSGLQSQFYRHRQDPVPEVHRPRRQRIFRRPRTTNERRATPAVRTSREFLDVHGAVFKLRGKRAFNALPSLYDDIWIRHQRSWKKYRTKQWRNGGHINRRVHSPPFGVRVSFVRSTQYRISRTQVRKQKPNRRTTEARNSVRYRIWLELCCTRVLGT